MSSPAFQIRSRVPRIAEAAVERARLTVVPRRRVRAARVPFVSLVSLVLLGGVVGLLLFNTSMQQASFATTSLESQASTLTAREQTLRMELDVLNDPQRVAQEARRMGMVTAGAPAFLRLSDGKVLGTATPATIEGNVPIYPPAPAVPAILNPQPTYVDPPASGASAASSGGGHGKNDHGHNSSPTSHTKNTRR